MCEIYTKCLNISKKERIPRDQFVPAKLFSAPVCGMCQINSILKIGQFLGVKLAHFQQTHNQIVTTNWSGEIGGYENFNTFILIEKLSFK